MEENYLIEKNPAIKRGWLRALLMLIAFFIASVIFEGLVAVIIGLVTDTNLAELDTLVSNPDNLGIMFIMRLASLLITLIIMWVFRRYIDRKSILSMGFHLKGKYKDIIYGLFVGFLLISLGFVILSLTNNLEIVLIQYSSKVVFGGFFLFIIAAMVEEIVFRGYVLNNFMDSFKNKYIALLLSSILFALIHGMNPNLSILGFVNLIVAGMALGITYIYTKNLWFPVFLHVSWNFFQGPIFGFEVSGLNFNSIIQQKVVGSDLITGGDFGFEGSILITVLLLGMIVITDRILVKKTV